MGAPSASTRDLARRLLAVEAAIQSAADAHAHEAVRVCEKLRIALTRFAGADGFTSLLRRALALARAEAPSLVAVNVKPDCSMEGLAELASHSSNGATDAAASLTAHLLELLETFIGEPLTLRLVREGWPNASWDK